jgi:hypothetical protein
LHELLHLKWTKNLPSLPDEIGFERSAEVSGKVVKGKRVHDWANGSKNCDNYAWYSLYSYWNKLPGGNSDTCRNDAWPANVVKPNPTAF